MIQAPAPTANPRHKAEVGGHVSFGPRHAGIGRLVIPPPSASHARKASRFSPAQFYSSTQLDKFSLSCGFGVNETTIAQSTDNPNLLVGGANTYYDNSGNCQDSHTGVYSSSDGGQHWRFEVMPGLLFPSSGDPVVTYDPVRHVFVFAFVEFNRADDSMGRIGVEASSDGINWSRNTTLDSSTANYGTDKPNITVDQNPSSPHYGRVAVTWTQFFGNNAIFQEDYTDDAGASWHTSGSSVNFTNHECGNGTSPAFDANGELMVAWADCSGGVNSMYEELSTTGGASWTAPSDTQITTTHPIAGAEDPNAADCLLNNGGSAFRCNSFPTLAGDPNPGDAGGAAFLVGWADVRSTTQNAQTANVSQIMGLSTVNGGANWDHLAFLNFNNFGDKFFPAASFSPNGRLTVSYSSREDDATSGNPNGKKFNEHQTEASSLTSLRAASYVSYTTDGTLGDPGSLSFIGDYAGNTSLDANFDTFPIWTDLRNGLPAARTQDLCYADCLSFLSPDVPQSLFHTTGSTFTEFYEFNMDPTFGSGADFWNVVALRPGSDGTAIDDDETLTPNRYFNATLASSAFGRPTLDYVLVNGNIGHAANTAYFPQVHSFSTVGGSYSVEWDAGHTVLGSSSLTGAQGSSNVARVYDTFLSTGTTYFFGLRPNLGNSSSYSLTLSSANRPSFQGRANAVADSGTVPAGSPAFVQYATGADPSAFDGVVVLNDNSGSGGYTLYRDTAPPDGTIAIDGGAASTNDATLHLTLSSNNALATDPVSDMAFSINGGAFGAFQPFATSADVPVPAGDGVKSIAVEYRNGAGAVSAPFRASIYLVQMPPTVTSVAPAAGPTAAGTPVTIDGTNLAPGAVVKFGTATATGVTFVSPTQLTANAPSHAAGIVDVKVTTPAGTSPSGTADRYRFESRPTITSITPTSGPTVGGTTVTITGTNFVTGNTVKFGSVAAAAASVVSTTQINVHAPAQAAGLVDITVTTPGGTSAHVAGDRYKYLDKPTVTAVSPAIGPRAGANTVTITGTGFVTGATVMFGTSAAPAVSVVSSTRISVHAPAHAAGTIHVTVSTAGGTSVTSSADLYRYVDKPTVTAISPAGGPVAGGTTVTLTGTNFISGATVKFGTTAAASASVVSSTQIKVHAPAHAAGAVHITVVTPGGTSATSAADLYTYS